MIYILCIDEDYYRERDGRPEPIGRQAVQNDNALALESFQKDLDSWLKKNNRSLSIKQTFTVLAMVHIECEPPTAEALRSMPGVYTLCQDY